MQIVVVFISVVGSMSGLNQSVSGCHSPRLRDGRSGWVFTSFRHPPILA